MAARVQCRLLGRVPCICPDSPGPAQHGMRVHVQILGRLHRQTDQKPRLDSNRPGVAVSIRGLDLA